jgi:hypothetical protein
VSLFLILQLSALEGQLRNGSSVKIETILTFILMIDFHIARINFQSFKEKIKLIDSFNSLLVFKVGFIGIDLRRLLKDILVDLE